MSRRVHRLALLCSLVLGSPALADDIRLPSMGDPSQQVLSSHNEQVLGDAFMRHIRNQVQLIDDPEINAYLEQLGRRLAAASDKPDQSFTFFMVKDDSINAFAAPGGYIGINTGLLLAADSESELAAVLAHEIAHVTQRHLAREFESTSRMSLPTAVALLAAMLLATQSGEAGQAALMSLQAGSMQRQINFTRANEKEADRIGMQVLSRAGFDPAGMPEFFGKLLDSARYYRQPPPFLSTHPVTSDRIAEAKSRLDAAAEEDTVDNSLRFELMRTKLQVLLADDPGQVLEALRKAPPGGPRLRIHGDAPRTGAAEATTGRPADSPEPDVARAYGIAYAELLAGEPRDAAADFRKLESAAPDNLSIRIGAAQAALSAGDTRTALAAYQELHDLNPRNPVITEYYARALLKAGEASHAERLLTDLTQSREVRPTLYRELANAAGLAGHQVEAHEALARYYFEVGDLTSARQQIESAQRLPKLDAVTSARLEAQLKRVERAMKEQPKDPLE